MRDLSEPWRYNPQYATAIDLDGCQFGLEVDGRCNKLLCKFRTRKEEAPETVVKIGLNICPKEQEYDLPEGITRVSN